MLMMVTCKEYYDNGRGRREGGREEERCGLMETACEGVVESWRRSLRKEKKKEKQLGNNLNRTLHFEF